MQRDVKPGIEYKMELVKHLTAEIYDTLESLDTETVDKMKLYEPGKESVRRDFYDADRNMYLLERYFNDERWDGWTAFRDDERGENA